MGFLGIGNQPVSASPAIASGGAGFSYLNARGVTYYLHERKMPNGNVLHFFSKDPTGSVPLPAGYDVIENPRTGLPFIKKKA